jgi:hypothetical protein
VVASPLANHILEPTSSYHKKLQLAAIITMTIFAGITELERNLIRQPPVSAVQCTEQASGRPGKEDEFLSVW